MARARAPPATNGHAGNILGQQSRPPAARARAAIKPSGLNSKTMTAQHNNPVSTRQPVIVENCHAEVLDPAQGQSRIINAERGLWSSVDPDQLPHPRPRYPARASESGNHNAGF